MAGEYSQLHTPGAGVVGVDETGTIRLVSPQVCSALGYQQQELVGQPLRTFLATDPAGTVRPTNAGDTVLCRTRGGAAVAVQTAPAASSDQSTPRTPSEAQADEDIARVLFDANPLPMWIYDRETLRFLEVNEAAINRYGYSHDDFLKLTIADVRPPDEVARLQEYLPTLTPGATTSGIWHHITKSGEVIDVEVTSHDLFYADRPARIVVVESVTERELARYALQQSEEQHRKLVELSPDLVLILHDDRVAFVNAAGANILGAATREELIGRSFLDFVSPDAQPIVAERLRQIREEGLSVSLVEEQLRRVDGASIEVELVAIPFSYRDRDAVLIIARDITERRASHELLRRSISLLRSTLDSTADGIMVLDLKRQLLTFNERLLRIWNIDRSSVESDPQIVVRSIVRSIADPRPFVARLDELQEQRELELHDEVTLVDGRVIEAFSMPHRVGAEPVGRVWSFRDVTERARTADALARRDAILQAVAFAAERFLSSDGWNSSIHAVIRRLGEAARAHAVSVYEFRNAMNVALVDRWMTASAHDETTSERFSPETLVRLQDEPVVEQMRPVGEVARQRLLVSLRTREGLWGFVSFENHSSVWHWTQPEIDALRAAAQTLAASMERRNAEEELRRSEARYRRLFERNLAGVYRNTMDGRILDCNEALARILGFSSRRELLDHRATEAYFATEQREFVMEDLKKNGFLANKEVCLKRKDGRAVWVLENVALVEGPDGEKLLEGTIIDITDRKRAEEGLRQSEERYRMMAENTTDMLSRLTPSGVFVYVSPACRLLLGVDVSDLIGHSLDDFVHPDDRDELAKSRQLVLASAGVHTTRLRMRRSDDTYVWVETTSRGVRALHFGDTPEIISVSRDITERKRAEELIEYQAFHDPLTGLPNRSMFSDRLEIALNHARRMQRQVAVMFLDLDHFKEVNDTRGHTTGDQLLREVAARLRASVRQEDTLARIGGDEFTLLLLEVTDREVTRRVGEKVLSAFNTPFTVAGEQFSVSASVGIAMFPAAGETAEELLRAADAAMYVAKSAGRNRVEFA